MNDALDPKRAPWRTTPEWWERLKPLARQNRYEPTSAESRLWQCLRRNALDVHFRRQHAIERFIVDFYCASANLVVEVDGAIHEYTTEEDALRQEYLESLGLRVVRFTNQQIFDDLEQVLLHIRQVLVMSKPHSLT